MMTVKEKAKAYDEAIKVAKRNYETIVKMDNDCTFAKEGIVNTFHHMFPELKESEDERIRKGLIEACKQSLIVGGFHKDKVIAWLEKQGEQKLIENADDKAEKYAKTLYCSNLEAVNDIGNCSSCENVKTAFKAGLEKQGEQKPDTTSILSAIPPFKVGDTIKERGHSTLYKVVRILIDGIAYVDDKGEEYTKYYDEDGWDSYELAESEDEKIRKALVKYFQEGSSSSLSVDLSSAITWLEKQGEQKPVEWSEKYIADVFEKVGLAKVVRELANDELTDALQFAMIELAETNPPVEWNEEDNDMLNRCISLMSYNDAAKEETDWLKFLKNRVLPQPKQEWSEEDEEIINNIGEYLNCYGNYIADKNEEKTAKIYKSADWLKSFKDRVRSKQEWSKEDEKILRGITAYVSTHACELDGFDKWYEWLQALKDRCLPQPKTEWNEKDKNHIDSIMQRLKGMCKRGMTFTPTCYAVSEDISWLKSIRPQKQWKPSEAQMEALEWQVRNTQDGSWQYMATKELLKQLRKLQKN